MKQYISRINVVLDYIEENIFDNINLDEAAKMAGYSKFYFHRMFKSVMNETLADYIKRIRIEKSAEKLMFSSDSILDIAIRMGFSSISVFSREFTKYYQISPFKFRSMMNKAVIGREIQDDVEHDSDVIRIMNKMTNSTERPMPGQIIKMKPVRVLYRRHIGEYRYDTLFNAWVDFLSEIGKDNLIDEQTKAIGVIHGVPWITTGDRNKYDTSITISDNLQLTDIKEGLGIKEIEGGLYGVFDFAAETYQPMDEVNAACIWIIRTWSIENKCVYDDRHILFLFDERPVAGAGLKFKIYFPIRYID